MKNLSEYATSIGFTEFNPFVLLNLEDNFVWESYTFCNESNMLTLVGWDFQGVKWQVNISDKGTKVLFIESEKDKVLALRNVHQVSLTVKNLNEAGVNVRTTNYLSFPTYL